MMETITNLGGLIIDMDGVLWHEDDPMDGLDDFFLTLRDLKIPFVMATNNASRTQRQYVEKFHRMGVKIHEKEILTSSMATVGYMLTNMPEDHRRVYAIGETGLTEPLTKNGFILTDLYEVDPPNFKGKKAIKGADCVVVGVDRKLNWDKLSTATLNIDNGARFVATNADNASPTDLGNVMGNGGILAALTTATNVEPVTIGKPNPALYHYAVKILGTTATNTIAIGDRLDTDIAGAAHAGMRSILVLSGISKRSDIAKAAFKPTWVMNDISEIASTLRQNSKKK